MIVMYAAVFLCKVTLMLIIYENTGAYIFATFAWNLHILITCILPACQVSLWHSYYIVSDN